jgi:N-carbamoyl-L-amino-acid hydrolase
MGATMPTSDKPRIAIDPTRLWSRIERLSSTPTRLAFTEEDRVGRDLTIAMMQEAGLDVRIDPACNIIGRRPGRSGKPAILFGSHIDTVPNGGRFDGILGCLAGIECLHTLNDAQVETEHPLEVVVFANEEGQTYAAFSGSRAMIGLLQREELERRDRNGRIFADAIKDYGGDPGRIHEAIRRPGDVAAYIELHVEQGGVLESTGIPIGVVEGIVGLTHCEVVVTGYANHAGTTPMPLRRDALVAASRFVIAVNDTIRTNDYCAVGTVGRMIVSPNARNVVPGEVRLTLDLRDLILGKTMRALESLQEQAKRIAKYHNVEFNFNVAEAHEPAIADRSVMNAVLTAASDIGLDSRIMPSGAGHDAQMIARIAPMGMIFVPSVGGVSHSDKEFTSPEDCANGANVLLGSILKMDTL